MTFFKRLYAVVYGEDFIKELKMIDTKEWPQMWCEINSWKWPKQLDHVRPLFWFERNFRYKRPFVALINGFIEIYFTDKQLNRQWNIDRMTDEEHEVFWLEHHGGKENRRK